MKARRTSRYQHCGKPIRYLGMPAKERMPHTPMDDIGEATVIENGKVEK
jgi:hypothetical protein